MRNEKYFPFKYTSSEDVLLLYFIADIWVKYFLANSNL